MQQAQAEGACLLFPDNVGIHQTVTYDTATAMLQRALSMSLRLPYTWGYIDKPPDGQIYLLFMRTPQMFPNDGIRYQDEETRFTIPAGPGRELEVCEIKHGYIPNSQDAIANRVRRRYRLHRGGHPQIVLVHYTRGPPLGIYPDLMNRPVRNYPLRPINEPAIYVVGENAGQKVLSGGQAAMPPTPQGVNYSGGIAIPGANQQTMLAQQNANMEALERRSQRERSSSMSGQRPPVQRMEDDDSGDEGDQVSTKALALARYRRNHELMNEVFMHAAFGEKKAPPKPPSYSTLFNKSDLEEKVAKLNAEIEELTKQREERASREVAFDMEEAGDVSMDSIGTTSEGMSIG